MKKFGLSILAALLLGAAMAMPAAPATAIVALPDTISFSGTLTVDATIAALTGTGNTHWRMTR